MKPELHARYDRRADVLYVFTDINAPAYAQEAPDGIVWRFRDSDDKLISAIIIDFEELWARQLPDLAAKLAKQFHVSRPAANKVLEDARG